MAEKTNPAYLDASLPMEKRVKDLLAETFDLVGNDAEVNFADAGQMTTYEVLIHAGLPVHDKTKRALEVIFVAYGKSQGRILNIAFIESDEEEEEEEADFAESRGGRRLGAQT